MVEMTSNDDRVLNEDFVRSLIQDFIHSRVFRVVHRVKYSSNEEDEWKKQFIFRFQKICKSLFVIRIFFDLNE